MTAIETIFHGPTNARDARISATAMGTKQRVYVDWDQHLNADENHDAAARALITKMDWWQSDSWIRGAGDRGARIYVCLSSRTDRRADQTLIETTVHLFQADAHFTDCCATCGESRAAHGE